MISAIGFLISAAGAGILMYDYLGHGIRKDKSVYKLPGAMIVSGIILIIL